MTSTVSTCFPLESEKQLKELYRLYKGKFYANAFRVLKSQELSEEVVQDVFISIWNHREKISETAIEAERYLFGILSNKIYDALRTVIKMRIFEYIDAEPAEYEVDQWYAEKELRSLLEQLIERMPEKQQQIFRLIKIDGMKREEVAKMLGISPHTVKNHLLTATRFLRENLDVMLLFHVSAVLSEKYFMIN